MVSGRTTGSTPRTAFGWSMECIEMSCGNQHAEENVRPALRGEARMQGSLALRRLIAGIVRLEPATAA